MKQLVQDVLIQFALIGLVPFGMILIVKAIAGDLSNDLFSRSKAFLAVSTIVHELCHLVMAGIFFLHINQVSLFRPNDPNGNIGKVGFLYNENSRKDRIGVGMSGIAPVIGIILIILFIYSKWFPQSWASIQSIGFDNPISSIFSIIIKLIFPSANVIKDLGYALLVFLLAPGLSLSQADLDSFKVGRSPIGFLIVLLLTIGNLFIDDFNGLICSVSFAIWGILLWAIIDIYLIKFCVFAYDFLIELID